MENVEPTTRDTSLAHLASIGATRGRDAAGLARFSMTVLATTLVSILTLVTTADAHRPQFKTDLIRLDGNQSNGFLTMRPTTGGSISLDLPQHPAGGALLIAFRVNGVTTPVKTYPISGDTQTWPLGFATKDQDKLEVHDVRVVDHLGNAVAVIGAAKEARSGYLLAAPLVWVVDTASDVGFTRGGDTLLKRNGGWTVGFDALRSRSSAGRLNNVGNYAEIEVSVNDGPWQIFSVTFDVQSGKSRPGGRPGRNIGTTQNDRVQIRRVDVFDSAGQKFAMLGIRMGKQGHYAEVVPTLGPSATPTAVPTPTPSQTASPTPIPEPTATPEPTAGAEPTPDATPEPSLTPEPTA